MTNISASSLKLQDFLLEQFTQEDFASARENLMQRYTLFQGILISNDGESILTPDDLDTFRKHAAEFTHQQMFSDYEKEQLKILTVLIYLLMNANKGIARIPTETLNNPFWSEHGKRYIIRKLYHQAKHLDVDDIQQLLSHQNQLIQLYEQAGQQTTLDTNQKSTLLSSKTGDTFVISLAENQFTFEHAVEDTPTVQITIPYSEAKAQTSTVKQYALFRDQEKTSLLETAKATKLNCGINVAAASYIGVKRKANEDGIVIIPEANQVTVIDGMGGYGNGSQARDLFSEALIRHPSNVDQAVIAAQQSYDANHIGTGGVCTMNMHIKKSDSHFEIDLGQAGDVHVVLFDDAGQLQYESIDEAIGHKVINAIMGQKMTDTQRKNGWTEFGLLTHNILSAKNGWRMATYSDGIANHFDAETLQALITNCTPKTAIGRLSSRLTKIMLHAGSYRDNCSIAILDF